MVHLSQVLGALLAEGYSVEFDPIGKNTMVSVRGERAGRPYCAAQAVGVTPSIAVMNLLERILERESLNPSLAKLAKGLR